MNVLILRCNSYTPYDDSAAGTCRRAAMLGHLLMGEKMAVTSTSWITARGYFVQRGRDGRYRVL